MVRNIPEEIPLEWASVPEWKHSKNWNWDGEFVGEMR